MSAETNGESWADELDEPDWDAEPELTGRRTRDRAGREWLRPRRLTFRDRAETADERLAAEPASADEAGPPGGWPMTYTPARFEAVWLAASLRSFFEQELIVDVLAQVKGGKEANVYRCQAHPRTGAELLAAKVYRPRKLRNLSNDRVYREGREYLSASGGTVQTFRRREHIALNKKTDFGVRMLHTSWLMHERATLELLERVGGAAPRPYGVNENAILMSYLGDAQRAAPPLSQVSLSRREAARHFAEVVRNVELLLEHGLIHGDLSAYNVLHWKGEIALIDFPQVTSAWRNPHARAILERDVQRLCEYFARQGVRRDPVALAAELWQRHGGPAL